MRIIKADVLGMCFGVRDALAIIEDVANPKAVTIHGELVHNEKVLDDLHDRGFRMIAESQRRPLPITQAVLITAHGISQKERARLKDAGKELIDTTCPLVTRAHQAAQSHRNRDHHHRGHHGSIFGPARVIRDWRKRRLFYAAGRQPTSPPASSRNSCPSRARPTGNAERAVARVPPPVRRLRLRSSL